MTALIPEELKPQLHRMIQAGKSHGECASYFRTSRGLEIDAAAVRAALGLVAAGESHARRIREALAKKRELTLDDLVRATGSTRQRLLTAINKLMTDGEVRRCYLDGVALYSMRTRDE